MKWPTINSLPNPVWFCLAALAYWLLCEFSNVFAPEDGAAGAVWLADGFALGLFLLAGAGRRAWVLGATVAGNLLFARSSPLLILIVGVVGNTAKTWLAGSILLALEHRRPQWRGLQHALAFVAVALILVNALVAMIQAPAFVQGAQAAALRQQFEALFVSNAIGVLALTPLMLAWREPWAARHAAIARAQTGELLFLAGLLLISTLWIFSTPPDAHGRVAPYFYLIVPVLLWIVLRFSLRGETLGFLAYALLSIFLTCEGLGPFQRPGLSAMEALLHLQEFLLVLGATAFLMATVTRERAGLLRAASDAERRFSALLRASGNAAFEANFEEHTIHWMGDTDAAMGIAQGTISTTRGWTARVHPDDQAYLLRERKRLVGGEIKTATLEYRVRRDDGGYIPIGVNAFVHRVRGKQGIRDVPRVLGFVRDMTERQRAAAQQARLETELRQAQKLEAIGTLAGGIAHDFNNILASIVGYGEMARERAGTDGKLQRHLDTLLGAAERARQLTAQILTFGRKETGQRATLSAADLVREVAALIGGSHATRIEVGAGLEAPLQVRGNATELHQLLMNLATNAVQAMKGAGELHFDGGTETHHAPLTVAGGQLTPGSYVWIEVRDRGPGIDAATRERMFEPFFTTKPAGKGTGLGLALVLSIARAHGGGVRVESTPGWGTRFRVYLPATGENVEARAESTETPRGRDELILVADDDAALRDMAAELLASLGYQVACYENATLALAAVTSGQVRPDAVMTDEVMPDLTGTQLTAELRRCGFAGPVLIVTGFGGPGFEIRAQQAGVSRVMRKPYTRDQLGHAMHALLAPPVFSRADTPVDL
ncbi:MAG: MASE1 domain-containing protein [Betaproteobacteria bacterium]|nr:MASE1 domain-containing protein [Betaproteobacteria bacterium]